MFLGLEDSSHAPEMLATYASMRDGAKADLARIDAQWRGTVIDPALLARVTALRKQIEAQQKHVNVLAKELEAGPQHIGAVCVAELLIIKDPFPMIITKGKQLDDDQLTVKLLTGTMPNYEGVSTVKASLALDQHQRPTGTIDNNTCNLDSVKLTASFALKFSSGTRKSPVSIRFAMQIQQGEMMHPVESDLTDAFIVITNDSQWEGSIGYLLKRDLFGNASVNISWPFFVNELQKQFIWVTRQDPLNPRRPLSQLDIQYLHLKFFQLKGNITQVPQFGAKFFCLKLSSKQDKFLGWCL